MTTHLYLAPAAAGKTAYLIDQVRQAAAGLEATPRVVVASTLQLRSWRHRLAEAGGAIGVRVLTFGRLYSECLSAAGESCTEISEPVQYRLIRSVVDGAPLSHYKPLVNMPGFIEVLQHLIGDLKAACIRPDAFTQAVADMGGGPRLTELALIYAAYQDGLKKKGWADAAGIGWLAAEAAEQRAPGLASDWPLLVVDGFDSFTSVQLSLLSVLARRAKTTLVALTGTLDGSGRVVHSRFRTTLGRLKEALGVKAAEPLPRPASRHDPALAHLEARLLMHPPSKRDAGGAVEFVEAPDRAAEARAALRWLKARIRLDGMRPGELALLARDTAAYRPFLLQVAEEFGLPIRLVGGLPLNSNPAVSALMGLLRLTLPVGEGQTEPALPRRAVIEAWRSPYFDWSALPAAGSEEPIGIEAGDAEKLQTAALWGRVICGLSQWREALAKLEKMPESDEEGGEDEERRLPRGLVRGPAAGELLERLERLVERLKPPADASRYRDFVRWLEDLMGADPEAQSRRSPPPEEPTALKMVAQARKTSEATAERDVAALHAFKDILRGLVSAEEVVSSSGPLTYDRFLSELAGSVETTGYTLPAHPERGEIVVADVVQARGVPFRAVAVLGLAEGEFPRTISEDPFLRDADREQLGKSVHTPLDSSTASAEPQFFYEAVTRPREKLLLTRPRLADNGALWQASPYWDEVLKVLSAKPVTLLGEVAPPPEQAASLPELMESLAAQPCHAELEPEVQARVKTREAALEHGAQVLRARTREHDDSPFDGDMAELSERFGQQYGPGYIWSATRLESYRACPFSFFMGKLLTLEPLGEPEEGLNAAQLGTIYHRILERVHQAAGVSGPANLDQLLAALPAAAKGVLDGAPTELGFRETAWWEQTRMEIEENVRRTLEKLAPMSEGHILLGQEVPFGKKGKAPLQAGKGGDVFLLRGIIDRVDKTPNGGIRIIDYKSGGKGMYDPADVAKGKKLQLPLYALAAREAFKREPVEGFYWHIKQAEPSAFKLSTFGKKPEDAMDLAVEKAWEAVTGVRGGHFRPKRPDDGCPSYCVAAGFCWHYRPGYGG
jgi:ATP-dependent helicase/DNAse subunit B